jgi:hypothetical protein
MHVPFSVQSSDMVALMLCSKWIIVKYQMPFQQMNQEQKINLQLNK